MSRFGTTAKFVWGAGDGFAFPTTIELDVQDMPQFPFDTEILSDSQVVRTKSGQRYEYQNWSTQSHTISFVGLSETKRDELFTMINSLPIVAFSSPPTAAGLWGTYRAPLDSWSDSESSHEKYDVSFNIERLV
jgi:hypothetical protein